jgi:hypothetical protein
MAQIKEVTVTYGRKINLGDFNSAHVELTVNAELEDGDDIDATMRALWEMVTNNVRAKAAEFYPKIAAQELFLGLPIAKENDDAH